MEYDYSTTRNFRKANITDIKSSYASTCNVKFWDFSILNCSSKILNLHLEIKLKDSLTQLGRFKFMTTLVLELTKTELMRKQNMAPVICPLRLKELLSDIIDVF